MAQSVLDVAMQNVLEVLRRMPAMMTVEQAVEVLNVGADDSHRWSKRSFYWHAQRGEVPARKVGRMVLVPKAELMAWMGLKGQEVEPTPAPEPERRETERRMIVTRVPRRYAVRLARRRD